MCLDIGQRIPVQQKDVPLPTPLSQYHIMASTPQTPPHRQVLQLSHWRSESLHPAIELDSARSHFISLEEDPSG